MAIEDQVKALEDEFKLLKSEMRQTLVNVREFLMDLKLPPIQEEAVVKSVQPPAPAANEPEQSQREEQREERNEATKPPAPATTEPEQSQLEDDQDHSEGVQHATQGRQYMPERQANATPRYNAEPRGIRRSFPPPATETHYAPPDSAFEERTSFAEDNQATSRNFAMDDIPTEETTAGEIPMENEQPIPTQDAQEERSKSKKQSAETGTTPSQINLLVNLIRWVASAKKEVGIEQLPVFLDVYAISGNLPEQMKDVILHLAHVATDPVVDSTPPDRISLIREQLGLFVKLSALNGQNAPQIEETINRLAELLVQQSTQANKANVWSQLLLELNGILGDGAVSLNLLTQAGPLDGGVAKAESDTVESTPEQSENTEEEHEIPTKSKSARLRLVLPDDSGNEQELDLGELLIAKETPKHSGNGHKKVSIAER